MLADIADQQHTVIGPEAGEKFAHLVGTGKARFIYKVKVLLAGCGCVRRPCKEALQGSCLDPSLRKLACRAGRRSEPLDLVALCLSGAADHGKRRRFARTGKALNSLNAIRRVENILHHALLRPVKMWMLVGYGDGLRTRQHRLGLALPLAHPADNFMFGFNCPFRSALTARYIGPLDDLKFPGGQTRIKVGAYLAIGDLAHPAPKPVADQRPFINHGFALGVLVAGKGQRFADLLERVGGPLLMLEPLACFPNHGLRLVAKVCRQLPVRCHHLAWRVNLLAVTGGVRGDLGGFFSGAARALQILADLLAARARCVEVFLGVSLDFRSTATSGRYLVTKLAQPVG